MTTVDEEWKSTSSFLVTCFSSLVIVEVRRCMQMTFDEESQRRRVTDFDF
jgi:hypothetical protein